MENNGYKGGIYLKKEKYTNGHPATWIQLNKKKVHIDNKLVNLIRELNRVGLKTTQCCQGSSMVVSIKEYSRPYISISLDNVTAVVQGDENRLVLYWGERK